MLCIGISAPLVAQTTATQAVVFEFAPSAVTDAGARGAVGQIQALEAKIQEYAAVAEIEMELTGEQVLMRDQVAFRRPYLFSEKKTVMMHPVAALAGQVQWTTNDGEWIWQYYQDRPGAREEATKAYQGKMPDAALKQILDTTFGPQARRYSARRVLAEPRGAARIMDSWNIHDALTDLDPKTLKLAGETAEEWVLAGGSLRRDYLAKVNVDKGTGTARRVEIVASSGLMNKVVVTVREIRVNPSPGLNSEIFHFVPPVGLEFKDETDSLLAQWREQTR